MVIETNEIEYIKANCIENLYVFREFVREIKCAGEIDGDGKGEGERGLYLGGRVEGEDGEVEGRGFWGCRGFDGGWGL